MDYINWEIWMEDILRHTHINAILIDEIEGYDILQVCAFGYIYIIVD